MADPPVVTILTVLATQNPIEYEGTYPLPEAQLDRFMIKIVVDYPTLDAERAMVARMQRFGENVVHPERVIQPVVNPNQLLELRAASFRVDADESVVNYIVEIVRSSRSLASLSLGASPRSAVMLLRAAKAFAVLRGKTYVTPDDVTRHCSSGTAASHPAYTRSGDRRTHRRRLSGFADQTGFGASLMFPTLPARSIHRPGIAALAAWAARFLRAGWRGPVSGCARRHLRRRLPVCTGCAQFEVQRRLWTLFTGHGYASIRIVLTNHSRRILRIVMRDELPVALQQLTPVEAMEVPPKFECDWTYEVRPVQRGRYQLTGLVLAGRAARRPDGKAIQTTRPGRDPLIYPRFATSDEYRLLARINQQDEVVRRPRRTHGRGTDFESLSNYNPGDDLRTVDWKISAKRGS